MADEVENLRIALAHLADDHETLRGTTLRTLTKQLELLNDGLHALRSGHLPIADEYMDRAIRAIAADVERLRAN